MRLLVDIVLDTNVLVHAKNRNSPFNDHSNALLEALRSGSTVWLMDEGFDIDEATNKSRIYSEYRSKLVASDVGLATLATLARTGRVRMVPACSREHRDLIRRWIKDAADRYFVRTACESTEKTFVTHDDRSMPQRSRNALKEKLRIVFVDAAEAHSQIGSSQAS
jgi:predicted nucleic acid-binding protein